MSPSDAVATSNVKKAGVNRRVISILDGEGLDRKSTRLNSSHTS